MLDSGPMPPSYKGQDSADRSTPISGRQHLAVGAQLVRVPPLRHPHSGAAARIGREEGLGLTVALGSVADSVAGVVVLVGAGAGVGVLGGDRGGVGDHSGAGAIPPIRIGE
jgi:hypothetical protein